MKTKASLLLGVRHAHLPTVLRHVTAQVSMMTSTRLLHCSGNSLTRSTTSFVGYLHTRTLAQRVIHTAAQSGNDGAHARSINLPPRSAMAGLHCPDWRSTTRLFVFTIGALADTGSAAHAADKARHSPGHALSKSKLQRLGVKLVVADGGCTDHSCECDIGIQGTGCGMRPSTVQNA